MELFRIKNDIPFMRHAPVWVAVSALIFLAAVAGLVARGLNLSIDFTGGTVIEVGYPEPVATQAIRDVLTASGYGDATVQTFGTPREALIRFPVKAGVTSAQLSETILGILQRHDPKVEMRRVEFVGPQVGSELFNDGALALMLVSALIMVYLAFRFEWRFSVGAIVATIHDVVIVLGLFAWFQWEFSLTVLAAVLAILGYSVNDTVVVFDRIRENFRRLRRSDITEIIDNAITRTLARTFMTAITTQLMVLAMLLFGGEVLYGFALALTIGIVVGTYSSVLVASPVIMWLGISREDMLPPKTEGAADNRP
ncbi:MAG TPA: protein translocase subunit SecF [Acidiferrobacterales bacterium]